MQCGAVCFEGKISCQRSINTTFNSICSFNMTLWKTGRQEKSIHVCIFVYFWLGRELVFPSRWVKLWYHTQGIVGKSSMEATPGKWIWLKKEANEKQTFLLQVQRTIFMKMEPHHRGISKTLQQTSKAVRWIDWTLFSTSCLISRWSVHIN